MNYPYINVDDVRAYLMDRSPTDNDLDMDLSFSDEEISQAMTRCARSFNSIPPLICKVAPSALPGDTNIFLDGTIQQLLIAKLNKMSRNDIDYQAGNVSTNLVAKRISHYKELIKLHGDMFNQASRDYKISVNINRCMGPFQNPRPY